MRTCGLSHQIMGPTIVKVAETGFMRKIANLQLKVSRSQSANFPQVLTHTMPGESSTSSVSPKSGTTTAQPHSHVGIRICWSLKSSKANFCTVAKIRGEIGKNLKCVIWAMTP